MSHFDHLAFNALLPFVNRWHKKRCGRDRLTATFDTFIMQYIIYAAEVNVLRPTEDTGNRDTYYCTQAVVDFLFEKPTNVVKQLDKSARQLGTVIVDKGFSVCSSRGDNPNLLETWLEAPTEKDKLLALLRTLYYMRCNLFHGQKSYHSYQIELLEPANKCLKILNKELMMRFKQSARNNIN